MSEEKKIDVFDAARNLVEILKGFDDEARAKIIKWAGEELGIRSNMKNEVGHTETPDIVEGVAASAKQESEKIVDIKELREEKKPNSGMQMAVLVAYYLKEHAPIRQDYITSEDITKYFTQASFRLPNGETRFTLANAKNAGYLESLGDGKYKLSPVGFNLAAYNMPTVNGSELKRNGVRKIKKSPRKKQKKSGKK